MRLDSIVKDVDRTLRSVLEALRNNLTIQDNFLAKIVTVTTPGGADVEFTVQHNLGHVPTAYMWNVNANAVVYDSRRSSWTSSQMFLKCSGTSVAVTLAIF